MDYKATTPVPTSLPKLKKKNEGITFPQILAPDTGIHTIKQIGGPRYKIYYHVDGKKRYTHLPKGTTIEEARVRRDTLYKNLKKLYGGRKRKTKMGRGHGSGVSKPLASRSFIRLRPAKWVVEIRGKHIGEAPTKELAEAKRDAWLADNSHLLEGSV